MIINTGQRTDIPAFYSKWFMNRIKEGFVMVRNPFYPNIVTRFSLSPDVVDIIGFCTKNPKPMLPYIDSLKRYGQFWYVTITAFDNDMEPNVPPIDDVIESVKILSSKIGKNAIGWRYTPIIVNDKYTVERHIQTFKKIAEALDGYVSLAVYGFVDVYDKLKKNQPDILDCDDETKIKLTKKFITIAKEHHMDLRLCSKEKWLKQYGVDVDGCMRMEDYEKALGKTLVPTSKMNARKGYCVCFLSNDIGTYNSCMHMCRYCYANGKKETILKNYQNHDDNSPFLIGHSMPYDKIKEASQVSWVKEEDINLFNF